MAMKNRLRLFAAFLLAVLLTACNGGGNSNSGTPQSSDATLSDLALAGAALDQLFQSSQLDYTAGVNFLVSSVMVTATANDVNAIVSINGAVGSSATVSLAVGVNDIDIAVTAEDGSTEHYHLAITRATAAGFAQQAYLKASNAGSGDEFGYSVAISADTLVVGAYLEDSSAVGGEANNSARSAGAAYVFTRSGGVWTQQAYLKAGNAEDADRFGYSVAISGDTLVVGATGEDSSAGGGEADNSAGNAGAAYVFTRSGGVWSQQAYLKASNAGSNDNFGYSVALSADTLVIGATGEDSSAGGGEADNSAGDAGAAYVFTRSGGIWSQQAYLKASNAEDADRFGGSVAISGDTLVIGAYLEDSSAGGGEADNSAGDAGAAYVFTRSGGVWTQQSYLKASNAGSGDHFGHSLAIAADTLVVGAYLEDSSAGGGEADNSAVDAGASYVFTRSGGVWSQQAYLKASNAGSGDHFGYGVAIAADTLVVGANLEDSSAGSGEADNSAADAGAAYVFTRSGGIWTQQPYLKASNVESGDHFGYSVAISADTLVVGATGEDGNAAGGEANNSAFGAGAAYVWQ